MNAPLARLTCEACGSQVMPALIRCPDCGSLLHKKKSPATASAIPAGHPSPPRHSSSGYQTSKPVSANDFSLNEMLSMAAPADACASVGQYASTRDGPAAGGENQRQPAGFQQQSASAGRFSQPAPSHWSDAGNEDPSENSFDEDDRSVGAAQSPQALTLTCKCGKVLRARPEQIGKRMRCPGCKNPLLIEASPSAVSPTPIPAAPSNSIAAGASIGGRRMPESNGRPYSFEEASKKLPSLPILASANDQAADDANAAPKKSLSRSQVKKLIAALTVEDPASQDEAVARRQAVQELGDAGETAALEDVFKRVDDPWIPVREAAATAMGTLKDPRATPVLVRMLSDDSASVCRAAVTSLGKIGDGRAVEPLVQLSLSQPHRKAQVGEAIGTLKAAAVSELLKLLKHADPGIVLEAVVLLGHLRDRQATDALIPFLNSDSAVFQAHAAESLGKISDPKTVAPLCQAAQSPHAGVRANAVAALASSGDKKSEKILLPCLHDRDDELRYHAVKGLAHIGDRRYLSAIVPLLADENDRVRGALADAFGELVEPRCIEPLLHLLQDQQESVRLKAATSLKKYRDPRIVPFLINGLNDDGETVQLRCIDTLGEQKSPDGVVPLISKLTINRSMTTRAAAAKALGEIGDEAAVDHLMDALKDEYSVRCKAIFSLGQIGSQKSLAALLSLLKDSIPEIRYHAATALGKMDNPYARLAIEKLLQDNSPMVRKCAAKILADLGDEQAAAFLKDDFILKRKPRPSVKKMFVGLDFGAVTDKFQHASAAVKIAACSVMLLFVGIVLGVAGLLPEGWFGSGSAAPVLRGNVAHAAFSTDGQQVAVARTRGLLEIYMRSEQAPPQQIPLSCQAVSFTPHPQLLLLASGKELLTWKGETPDAPPQSIAKFNAAIQFMTSTPDFKFAATWTTDGVVRIWNLTTMKEYQSLHIAVPQNQVIALSPDARMIVSGTQEGTVIVWDASSRAKLSEIPGLKGSVTALAFSRDGKRLAAGTKNGQYYVWEYATGKTLSEWNDPGAVRFLWVDMSRELVIAVSGLSNLKRWNWTDGSSTAFPTTDAESYDMLINSPDGKTIVAAGKNDSSVWLFDIEKGTLIETLDVEP
ncbi:MAG: HEAT repeat domain-containing protein [Planctomycetaceae bacterium]